MAKTTEIPFQTSDPLQSDSGSIGPITDQFVVSSAQESTAATPTDPYKKVILELGKRNNALTNRVKSLEGSLSSLEKKFIEIKDSEHELSTIKTQFEDKVESTQNRVIETLGIFVALFTFISININVLQGATAFAQAFSIIMISGGLLILFLLIMDLIVRYSAQNFKNNWYILSALLFIASGLLIWGGFNTMNKYLKEDEKNEAQVDTHVEKLPNEPVSPIEPAQSSPPGSAQQVKP